MSLKSKRVLVLNVDKDNDIGVATGIRTPLIGREKVVSAATLFAIRSPEDSDTNSIFAAINTYDSLVQEGYACEIAVIAGTEEGGFKADIKVASELEYVLKTFQTDGVVFVSDGAADEQVIPAIQSKVPVISVKRVFVQQEKSVEETYVLFYRYLKKLAEPQLSRVALGVPGVLVLALVALYLADLLNYALLAAGVIIGSALVIKGFNMDSSLKSAWSESPIRLITSVIGLIISSVAIYRGISLGLQATILPDELAKFASLALINTIDLLIIGFAIYLGGGLVVKYLEESPKIWHQIVGLVSLVFIRQIVIEAAPIIEDPNTSLIPIIVTSALGVTVCALMVITFSMMPRFRRKEPARSKT